MSVFFCWFSLPVFLQKIIFYSLFSWCKRSIWLCTYTLVSYHLASLYIPHVLCIFIYSLFSQSFLTFTFPPGIISERLTYRGLLQGSCLSPLLFNINMSSICHSLTPPNFKLLLNVDIVLFITNKFLDLSVQILNDTLEILSSALTLLILTTAPEKSNFMLFICRKMKIQPNI